MTVLLLQYSQRLTLVIMFSFCIIVVGLLFAAEVHATFPTAEEVPDAVSHKLAELCNDISHSLRDENRFDFACLACQEKHPEWMPKLEPTPPGTPGWLD